MVARALVLLLLVVASGTALAQTGVTNTVSITPPAGVVNSNPSPSCTVAGVCSAADADAVTSSADLSVTKVASVAVGTVGSTFSYVITFTNSGPNNAASVTLTDSLTAAGLTLVSAQASTGALSTSTGNVTLTFGTLASGASGTLTLTVLVSGGTGSITNSVGITSTTPDPTPSNNTATSTISRGESADLSITKVAGNATPSAGGALTYSLVITNAGPSAATGASFQDILPAGLGTITNIISAVGGGASTATFTNNNST